MAIFNSDVKLLEGNPMIDHETQQYIGEYTPLQSSTNQETKLSW